MALMNVFARHRLHGRQCSDRFSWPNYVCKSNFALSLILFMGHHLQHSLFRVQDVNLVPQFVLDNDQHRASYSLIVFTCS